MRDIHTTTTYILLSIPSFFYLCVYIYVYVNRNINFIHDHESLVVQFRIGYVQ
jgi:hypothetical protein